MRTTESSIPQGSGTKQLAQVIRLLGFNEFDRLELATVTAAPPAIRIRIDNMKIDLDAANIVIAEQLAEHTRTISIDGGIDVEMVVRQPLNVGDRVIVSSANNGQTYVILDKAVMV